jgi:AAA+ superfamily predicted ATPase
MIKTKESLKYFIKNSGIIKLDIKQDEHLNDYVVHLLGEDYIEINDASLEFDGTFYAFCKENGYNIKIVDKFSSVMPDELDVVYYDPYIACGIFIVEKNDFSLIIKSNHNNDKVITNTFVKCSDYDYYIKFKDEYKKWYKKSKGIVISVIGGDYSVLQCDKTFDKLFFGEYDKLKLEIKQNIEKFLNSEKLYNDNNIPWRNNLFIKGGSGSGKTELLNTIISNFDFVPITINKYNCDDSVLEVVFKLPNTTRKSLIFIEDVDELIDDKFVTVETLSNFMDDLSCNNGCLFVLTTSKKDSSIDKISFRFDKIINLGLPTYKESVITLYEDLVNKTSLIKLKKLMPELELNYFYMKKIRDIVVRNNIDNLDNKSKNFKDILNVIKSIESEKGKIKRKTNIKIGLIKGDNS